MGSNGNPGIKIRPIRTINSSNHDRSRVVCRKWLVKREFEWWRPWATSRLTGATRCGIVENPLVDLEGSYTKSPNRVLQGRPMATHSPKSRVRTTIVYFLVVVDLERLEPWQHLDGQYGHDSWPCVPSRADEHGLLVALLFGASPFSGTRLSQYHAASPIVERIS